MALQTLLSQTGTVATGTNASFPASDSIRIFQFNPKPGAQFSGTVVVEGSNAASPGAGDYQVIATLVFTNHSGNLTLEADVNFPQIRARITAATSGAISVYGNSADRAISGNTSNGTPSVIVTSSYRVVGNGSNFKISSVAVAQFTTDDIFDVNNQTVTLTQLLDAKQDKIGNITATDVDLNLLSGMSAYGLTATDMQKLADINVSAAEINRLAGVTGDVQTQIDNLSTQVGSTLSGVAIPASYLNSFFDAAPTVLVSDINQLNGLVADASDLNALAGTSGSVTAADFTKLGQITASAAEINVLTGFSGTVSDLNKIAGLSATSADLNAIAGYASTAVTSTEISYLAGLTENVQNKLNQVVNLSGLNASVADLNILAGAAAGNGTFANPISSLELSYLDGLTGNIQNQLDGKLSATASIPITQITGSSITIIELNYLQGVRSNIQAQIDNITATSLQSSGATMTGTLQIADGSTGAPSLAYASAPTTGLFLGAGSRIGMTVNGNRAVVVDDSFMSLGRAIAGNPVMRMNTTGPTTTAYGFYSDPGLGLYRESAGVMGIAAGTSPHIRVGGTNGVELGGNAADNIPVTVPGVASFEKLLGEGLVLAGTVSGAVGQTAIYTVPTGRTAIITKVIVMLDAVTNFTDGSLLRMNIGWGGGFDELLDNTANVNVFNPATYAFNTAGQVIILGQGSNSFESIAAGNGAAYGRVSAGQVVTANVTALQGADTFNLRLFVIGYEF